MITYFILLLSFFVNDPKDIGKINAKKKEAEKAFLAGDYQLATEHYSFLIDSMSVKDDEVTLNLAHALYRLGDTTSAQSTYEKLLESQNNELKSIALQQLGVISKEAGKLEEALQKLKAGIKANPNNREAVYNYEVVKKLLKEKREQNQQNQDQQNQDQQNQDQQNQDQQNQDQQNQDKQEGQDDKNQEGEKGDSEKDQSNEKEQEKGEEQEQQGEEDEKQKQQEQMTRDKLKEMGISEEKALQLLEAMRQSEIKYLQNQKRKATKRPPSGKPDW